MSQRWLTVPAGADPVLLVNATAAPETVALDRLTPGRCVIVRREDSVAANTVTIGVPSGWTLDGVADATTTIDADSEMRFVAIDLGFQSYGSGSSAAEVAAAVAAEATARNAAIATQHATDLGTYGPISSLKTSITYNTDGTVATVTETVSGAVTTYTYNADGTPATEARVLNGVTTTRTFTYTSGNLTAVN
jgi:YD repeat-containing protein